MTSVSLFEAGAPRTHEVLGLPVHILPDYPAWLAEQVARGQGTQVVTLNAEMAIQGERNAPLADIIHQAELVVPDGSGVVLYLRSRGLKVQRCPGIELAEALIQQAHLRGWRVLLYGGGPGVTTSVAERWQSQYPGVNIVGAWHGYLAAEEIAALSETIQRQSPQLVLVGLGVPRQEFWIAEHRHLCPSATWIGVGGSFDIWAGTKTRAPRWLRENHLEWVYRLYKEPWRWRRMLALPLFAWRAICTLASNQR
ncbi:WecB/TagA/CpsF family glycosyltransferase [Leptolyngbya sp. FACHB-261]|uniref:WecB/TagA/CpsF family glycosyltransferase n=1 Tax=Leptolyngbya sp. FACHB-261 TaxID=2692806 RepID=UPI0016845342|nr:WecB/TagA/CpsF family glycosyltransferase [Leptolyngbya sp. FACHB-261]MBD2102084.1 WecB/TagA/CpsF family glycosyltransferase [Leptolyngbya sp. FACHB-261]